MRNNFRYSLLAIIILGFSLNSCSFLEIDDENMSTRELAFINPTNVEAMCFNVYSYIPGNFREIAGNSTLSNACDEADLNNRYSNVQDFNNGTWGIFSNPDDKFSTLYAGIRAANHFLEGSQNLDYAEYKDADPVRYQFYTTRLKEYNTEVRFLRAFFYFELIKRYGGVPIITKVINLGDEVDLVRNTYGECVQFIASELNAILPNSRAVAETGFMGRVTKGAIYALKSRLYLYAASPLNNNGTYNLALCDSSARAFVALSKLGLYDLNIDYRSLFLNQTATNKEIIFDRRLPMDNFMESSNYPLGGAAQYAYNVGANATCPSQNLVDAYEMADGSKFDWNNPVHAATPFKNRDPRFGMSILSNGDTWNEKPVESFVDGIDGLGKNNATTTGYYLKKFVNEKLVLRDNRTASHVFHIFRYGEMLLCFAEAMNEVLGPDGKYADFNLSARDALNQIRNRTGVKMPAIIGSNSKEEFREKVRNERRVELAFENHRFWDVRRWMIADVTENAPLRGMKITKNQDNSFTYDPNYLVEERVFKAPSMYRYPISNNEIVKYQNLKQTENW